MARRLKRRRLTDARTLIRGCTQGRAQLMAIKMAVIKAPGGALVPATEEDAEKIATMPIGHGFIVTIQTFHNLRFHRKLFVLFKLAFDVWRPPKPVIFQGQELPKSFDQFREDLTILAGHYTAHPRMDGTCRLHAKSLSFARMSDEQKLDVFRDVRTATWDRVLKYANYRTPEEVDEIVNRLIGFE